MIFAAQRARALAAQSFQPTTQLRQRRKCACGGTPRPYGECEECKRKRLSLQPELAINQPGDRYEQEADRVADAVLGGATSERPSISSLGKEGSVQGHGEGTFKEGTVAGKAFRSTAPAMVHEVLASGGQPLDAQSRADMEERFGHDFSRVRIHADGKAAESARAIDATAYTVGSQIVFAAGHCASGSIEGRRLLAHELTHVVQQSGGQNRRENEVSCPRGRLKREGSCTEESIMSDSRVPPRSEAANVLQRQTGDPFADPFGGEAKKPTAKKPTLDPRTKRAYEACPELCRKFMPVEVATDRFIALCDDTVKMKSPTVLLGGCTPGRLGNVVFVSGTPAWEMPTNCGVCEVSENGRKPPPTAPIKVGYIQTAEKVLSGGVYFKKDASGKWVWAANDWLCVANARDGHASSTAPWFGPDDQGNFKPESFGTCPALIDNPLVKLPSGQSVKTDKLGVQRPEWPLRRMRIDGVFHVWLVAQVGNNPPVFIHNWSIQCGVVAVLNDDADPCNKTGWVNMDMKKVTSSGPGKGSATPVLTGATANTLKKKC